VVAALADRDSSSGGSRSLTSRLTISSSSLGHSREALQHHHQQQQQQGLVASGQPGSCSKLVPVPMALLLVAAGVRNCLG
jgi:hypothetical protein